MLNMACVLMTASVLIYAGVVSVDIDMSDITNLKCHMLCTGAEQSLCSDDYASRVLQRLVRLPFFFTFKIIINNISSLSK